MKNKDFKKVIYKAEYAGLSDTDEEESYSSITTIGNQSVISVFNDDGEEELIDLNKFYRQKSVKKTKEHKEKFFKDLAAGKFNLFRKQKDKSPIKESDDQEDVQNAEEEAGKSNEKSKMVPRLPFYRDHHLRTVLDIQEQISDW